MSGCVWLRGYTWEAPRCGGGSGSMRGSVLRGQLGAVAMQTLLPNTRIATSERAPWTVRVRETLEVQIVPFQDHTYFVFPLTVGSARIEGVVLP